MHVNAKTPIPYHTSKYSPHHVMLDLQQRTMQLTLTTTTKKLLQSVLPNPHLLVNVTVDELPSEAQSVPHDVYNLHSLV